MQGDTKWGSTAPPLEGTMLEREKKGRKEGGGEDSMKKKVIKVFMMGAIEWM